LATNYAKWSAVSISGCPGAKKEGADQIRPAYDGRDAILGPY